MERIVTPTCFTSETRGRPRATVKFCTAWTSTPISIEIMKPSSMRQRIAGLPTAGSPHPMHSSTSQSGKTSFGKSLRKSWVKPWSAYLRVTA